MSNNSKNKSNKIQSVFLFSDNDKTLQEIMEDAFINMLKTVHTSKLLDNCRVEGGIKCFKPMIATK